MSFQYLKIYKYIEKQCSFCFVAFRGCLKGIQMKLETILKNTKNKNKYFTNEWTDITNGFRFMILGISWAKIRLRMYTICKFTLKALHSNTFSSQIVNSFRVTEPRYTGNVGQECHVDEMILFKNCFFFAISFLNNYLRYIQCVK